jgi:outer membrane protein assembly factor BamE (lipoprotein component of BamABCDE complex)
MKRNSLIFIVALAGTALLSSCASTKSEIAKQDSRGKLEENQRLAEQERDDSLRRQQQVALQQAHKENLLRQNAIRTGKTGGN